MVPFYGQGLNCGLEDVRILQTILASHNITGERTAETEGSDDVVLDKRLEAALTEYSETRYDDLVAIRDLAMQN